MNNSDLTGIYKRFAVKAHHLDHLGFLLETFHVVQIGKYGIPALYACSSGSHNHMLSGSHQLHTGSGNLGL